MVQSCSAGKPRDATGLPFRPPWAACSYICRARVKKRAWGDGRTNTGKMDKR